MSFSREIKDFVGAFQAGAKLWKDNEYSAARSAYYKAQTNKLTNPDPLDQEAKKLKVEAARAQINLTNARIGKMRSGGGRGGGAGGALPNFNPEDYRDGSELGDESDSFGFPDESPEDQTPALIQQDEDNEYRQEELGALDFDAPTMFAADGGMVEEPMRPEDESNNAYWSRERARSERMGEQPPASLSDAIGGGLKYLQRTFGLEGDKAALPGTDMRRQQGAQALVSGAGAPSDDEMRAVRKAIDPKNEVGDALANSTTIQRLYDFQKARGNEAGGAKAAGESLQYFRKQSAKLGALAQVALQNNDIDGAVNALIGGFNQIPDGNVAKRSGDKVMITNAKTGQPVEEIPITPQLLTQASRSLSDGASFYTHMAQKAAEGGMPGYAANPEKTMQEQTSDAAGRTFGGQGALPVGPAQEPNDQTMQEQTSGAAERTFGGERPAQPAGAPARDPDLPAASAREAGGAPFSDQASRSGEPAAPPRPRVDDLGIPIARQYDTQRAQQDLTKRGYNAKQIKPVIDNMQRVNAAERATYERRRAEAVKVKNAEIQRQEYEKRQDARTAATEAGADRREVFRRDTELLKDPQERRRRELGALDTTQQNLDIARASNVPANEDVSGRTTRTGRLSESTAGEAARRSFDGADKEVSGRRMEVTSSRADQRKKFDEDFVRRIAPYEKSVDALLQEGKEKAESGKIPEWSLPKMDKPTRRQVLDITDNLARFNDMNPETLTRAVFSITQNLREDNAPRVMKDGTVAVGNERLVMDRGTFLRLAQLRGERLSEYKNAEAKFEGEKSATAKRLSDQSAARSKKQAEDDEFYSKRQPGAIGTVLGTKPRAPVTPRGVLNDQARERWRKFNEANPRTE